MNVSVVRSVPFVSCKSVFLHNLKDLNTLPQIQQLDKFLSEVSSQNLTKLIVNDRYCSVDELREFIVTAEQSSKDYLYIAVNKFLIYTNSDLTVTTSDYDFRLVKYCQDIIKHTFTLLNYTIRPDDNGTLGNFVHPVTTMFFKRNV
jgi:hypothetical protein